MGQGKIKGAGLYLRSPGEANPRVPERLAATVAAATFVNDSGMGPRAGLGDTGCAVGIMSAAPRQALVVQPTLNSLDNRHDSDAPSASLPPSLADGQGPEHSGPCFFLHPVIQCAQDFSAQARPMNEHYPRFHLAFPVTDLDASRRFYVDLLGCGTGRESERWIDFDFFGHQLVAHLVDEKDHPSATTNAVDGHAVPSTHFGPILAWEQFHALARRLEDARVDFVIAPYLRFEGKAGEQATMFIRDPSGNHLEFKAFRDESMLFAQDLEGEAER